MKEEKGLKQQSFLQGAAVLAAATAIVKLIGAIYKIPLGRIIGDEGFGYFTTAYDFYSVLLMISTTGLPVAMSRMISQAKTLDQPGQIRKIFSTSLWVFLTIGVLGSLAMMCFPRQISMLMVGNDNSWAAILTLGPLVLFICVISAFRGFFQGQSNMIPTSVSQVFEALCKLIIGLTAAWLLMRSTNDPTLGAGGAILGVTIGGLVSALYLGGKYRQASKSLPKTGPVKSTKATMVELLTIAVPITLGAAGLQIINMTDTMVFMRRLVNGLGYSSDTADALKGIYNFCQTIFNLPCAFITPITISIIPAITAHLTMQNRRGARMVEGSAMRITGLIAMPCAFGLLALAGPIIGLLRNYGSETLLLGGVEVAKIQLAGSMMAYLGVSVIFNSLVLVTNAMMQAHGDVTTPVIHMIIGGVVKVVINYFLVGIPSLNMVGVTIGTVICYALITVLNVIVMIRKKHIDPAAFLGLLKPLLAGALMGACAYMANGFLSAYISPKLACLAAICLAGVIYLVLVIALKVITYDDCQLLPGGEKLAKLLRIRK